MEKFGSHRTDFHETDIKVFFENFEEIQVSLKSNKNNGYFT